MAAMASDSYEAAMRKVYADRLTRFYEKYDPGKVAKVDAFLTKYEGKEEALFRAMVKKYGPEPDPPEEGGEDMEEEDEEDEKGGGGGGGRGAAEDEEEEGEEEEGETTPLPTETYEEAMARMFKARLTAFYEEYDPSKVAQVDTFLTKYAGKEEALFKALVKKYGPEPDGGEDEDEGDEGDEDEEEEDDGNPPSVAPGKEAEEDTYEGSMGSRGDKQGDGLEGIIVQYCGVCSMPPEYCSHFSENSERCRPWLESNAPWVLAQPGLDAFMGDMNLEDEEDGGKKKKKKSSRGGKAKAKVVDESKQKIVVTKSSRGGKKVVTHVVGLEYFPDLKIKEAGKALGKRFACACAVKETPSGEKEVVIQGDVMYEIEEVLEKLFKISPSKVELNESSGKKKKKDPLAKIAAQGGPLGED